MDSKHLISVTADSFIKEIIAKKLSVSEAEEVLQIAQERLRHCTVSQPGLREDEEIEKALKAL